MTTAIKERPIIFSGPMVRAILSGKKTQTRRVVKFKSLEPGYNLLASSMSPGHYCTGVPTSGHVLYSRGAGGCWNQRTERTYCPQGNVGERLWVRETHSLFKASSIPASIQDATYACFRDASQIFCSGEYFNYDHAFDKSKWPSLTRWRRAIHMPRWASRLTLEITEVRVERLQAITEEDAIAEGLSLITKDDGQTWKYGIPDRDGLPGNDDDGWHWKDWERDPRRAYRTLWEKINAKRGHSWESNPWVWVITFKRVYPC